MVRAPKGYPKRDGCRLELALTLLLCCAAGGCWGPAQQAADLSEAAPRQEGEADSSRVEPTPAPRPAPRVDTLAPPKSPQEEPGPAATAPQTLPTEENADAEKAPEEPGFTLANLNRLEEGMSYGHVVSLVGPPGVTVARDGSSSMVYKWNKEGTSFLAKFKDGKLVRKSAIRGKTVEQSEGESPRLTEEQYNEVREGMTLEEVLALLDVEARAVGGGDGNVAIYRWRDDKGSSFVARFENEKLVRKSGIYVASLKHPSEAEKENEGEAASVGENVEQGEDVGVAEEGELIEGELEGEQSGRLRRRGPVSAGEGAIFTGEEEELDQGSVPEPPEASEVERRVRVAGSTRRSRESEETPPAVQGRSYKPKAQLPDCTYSLRRGSYEVRIYNESVSRVKAGLRSGKRGSDVTIPPGGRKSVQVDQGTYQLYYIYTDAPYALQGGEMISIDGVSLADVEIHLIDKAAEIGVLDFADDL